MDDTRKLLARMYVRRTLRHPLTLVVVGAVLLGLALALGLAFSGASAKVPVLSPAPVVMTKTTAPATPTAPASQAAYNTTLRALNAQDEAWWASNGDTLLALWVASEGRTTPRGAYAAALASASAPVAQVRNANDLLDGAYYWRLHLSLVPTVGALLVLTPQHDLPYGLVAYVTAVNGNRCVAADVRAIGKLLPRMWQIPCEPLVGRYFVS